MPERITLNACAEQALYSESTAAKIWGVAQRALLNSAPPNLFPEYTQPGGTKYVYREFDFWTSGFFPGCLYLLLERQRKFSFTPAIIRQNSETLPHPVQLQFACKWWTETLHQNSLLTNTHDLGFMIVPWARLAYELDGDPKAYTSIITAARSLGSRYSEDVGCIRSWDTCITQRYSYTDPSKDFLVIIDNMLNLDLLFWAAEKTGDTKLRDIAIAHAKFSQKQHIREDYTTFHVVNVDPVTGELKGKFTNQGYSDSSCWTRGQAWAITGFIITYNWTKDTSFLETSRKCADYFLEHLPSNGVPPWDFAAPISEDTMGPTDTSAALIATYGLLLLHEALVVSENRSPYLQASLRIIEGICREHLSPTARFLTSIVKVPSVEHEQFAESGTLEVDMGGGSETILLGATINNYEFAPRRWANHGLVYADYYFLLVGNKLLEMGIGKESLPGH